MKVQDLRKLLEETNDKFSIFSSKNTLCKYDMNISEFAKLIRDFLSDDEIERLFGIEYFQQFSANIKYPIIKTINDQQIKLRLLINPNNIEGFESHQIMSIIKELNSKEQVYILKDEKFISKYGIKSFEIVQIFELLDDEHKQELLDNKKFILEQLHMEQWQIKGLISSINSEDVKEALIDLYEFESYEIVNILGTFTDEKKIEILNSNKYPFNKIDIIDIFSKMDVDTLITLIKEDKKILKKNEISIYSITMMLDDNKQLELLSKIEELNINTEETRQILVTLNTPVKEKIDKIKLPPEYVSAIEIELCKDFKKYDKILVDLNSDLEQYKGLDELIYINPMEVPTKDKGKLFQLCEICPNVNISDNICLAPSTAEEYKSGEYWIESILNRNKYRVDRYTKNSIYR